MTEEVGMPKQFDYSEAEKRIYDFWEREGVFKGTVDKDKKPFCVVIPPPNVTGILHMGHVLDNLPQDVMTRWHRMRGFAAVWIPGTDHAGIATQNVVKKKLAEEGIDIKDLGREEFLKRVWAWKEKHGNIIIQQLKRLGCSCDWDRERFTMDEGLSKAVLTAFIHYYKKGLIYKGKRMINWCATCGTALANEEVEHSDHAGHLWHLRYSKLDSEGNPSNEYVVVATTRPETMLGDTAVAVNPADERYKDIIGKEVLLPLQDRKIPVIADEFVDPEFGTGIVKVTPAHDPNDYQMGVTHNLPLEIVIGEDGKMTPAAGEAYSGLDRYEARKKVVEDLEKLDLLEGIEDYSHSVGECYRCNEVIEPLVSDQWFVDMKALAGRAKKAVEDGTLQVIPESEKHDYYHWMDTIQDWCISRQLWWGHRIPVYYCGGCDNIMAEMSAPTECGKCGSTDITQDEDVLDTWFSSQLWPFSTLGWPEKTPELDFWYPNTWLMSGRDILFFWDIKMIVSGLELMDDVPFKTLALHGLVRDEKGRKLSKSLGNSPDPINLFDQYGTDAVRAAIAQVYPMGRQDTKLAEDCFKKGQSLIIKLWNASRLLLHNLGDSDLKFDSNEIGKEFIEDRWVLSRLRKAISTHDDFLNKSDIVHAFETLTSFFWNEYCDWYLEIIKSRLWDEDAKGEALKVAFFCERMLLKLMHPYIPFVTEELWQIMSNQGITDTARPDHASIALASWPEAESFPEDADAESKVDTMISLVKGIRDVRHHLVIPPKVELDLKLHFFDEEDRAGYSNYQAIAKTLGFLGEVSFSDIEEIPSGTVPAGFPKGVGYISIPENVDAKDIQKRLEKKIDKLEKGLDGVRALLKNKDFVSKAPQALIEENRAKAAEYGEGLTKLKEFLDSLLG